MTADLSATIKCPTCGHAAVEAMPMNSCLFFYECVGCGKLLKPKAGDCCVFCSYGDTPCPPVQQDCCRSSADRGCGPY